VTDTGGNPHVWIYGHGGRSGGQLGNVRSGPVFLGASALFLVEDIESGYFDKLRAAPVPRTATACWLSNAVPYTR